MDQVGNNELAEMTEALENASANSLARASPNRALCSSQNSLTR